MKRDLVIAIRGDPIEVLVPGFAGIDAELLAGRAGQQITRALAVPGSEGLAVVPPDAFAQRQGQLGPLLAPCPAGGQIGHDRLEAVLRYVLVEHDEVVEHPHHRPLGEDGRFLADRHARCAVGNVHFQNAARFFGECRISASQSQR